MSQEKDIVQVLSEGTYDLPLFLKYLKGFAVDGSQPERALLLGILMQSLARFHLSDFTACMCLVPSHVQESPSVENELNYIYELENLLSCGEFTKFWQQWGVVKEHLPESFNFETGVRTSILESISFTVEKIQRARLATYLGVAVEQLDQTIANAKDQGGEFACSCEQDEVRFSRNTFNHPEGNTNQETVKFKDVLSILQCTNVLPVS
ncbi:translation initiation factor 3 subunit K [Strigomonas culicis]|uniref:Translation initiation factor 3 subunit K n=2 Tax=Strigomonas culicis TaxID=28005 RepID=S9UVM6_9TRYP|nr:translation initiation factor 3 subunit K [Strigomonas culicis]|eukprot:EPY32953.1 translation initiation factor 3 subunit K [Strigomonas culicis]